MLSESPQQEVNIAGLLAQAGSAFEQPDYLQAERLYRQALNWLDSQHSEDSAEAALCLQNLAEIYYLSGQFYSAIPVYRRLLILGDRLLGEGHPDVLGIAFRLALTYDAVQMASQADDLYKEIINRAERNLGIAHPFTQKIRQAYFTFMSNRAPRENLDFDFTLPPEPPLRNAQPNSLDFKAGPETTDLPNRLVNLKKIGAYKVPSKIKQLRYGADSAEREIVTTIGVRRFWHRWRSVAIAIPCLVIFLAMVFMNPSKSSVDKLKLTKDPIALSLARHGTFQSVDGVTGVKFPNTQSAILLNDVHHRRIPCVILKGGLDDLKAMLKTAFSPRDNWYSFENDRLVSESGNILYAKAAPEYLIANKMFALKQFAEKYYSKTGCYPTSAKKWSAYRELDYMSPFTGRLDIPSTKTLNGTLSKDYLFPGMQERNDFSASFDYLRQGGTWREEAQGNPGKISILCLFKAQRCADGFKVNEFYMKGYDRNGQPLTGGKPGTLFVIGLKASKDLSQQAQDQNEDTQLSSVHPPTCLYIVPSASANLSLMHQAMTILMVVVLLASVCGWIFFELRKRLYFPNQFLQPYELTILGSALLLIITAVIHVLP